MSDRSKLMKENLRIRLEIEQMFIDADSWNQNVRKENEDKINPDPEGQLAGEWLLLHGAAIELSEVFKPAMEHHFKKYAPTDLSAEEKARHNSKFLTKDGDSSET